MGHYCHTRTNMISDSFTSIYSIHSQENVINNNNTTDGAVATVYITELGIPVDLHPSLKG